MRTLSLLLALPLLVACGKVTDSEPSALGAGAASDPPRGGAAPEPARGAGTTADPGTGGVGGGQPAMFADAGPVQRDASTPPPKPAADGGKDEDDAGSSSSEPLCDGSDAMRLAYVSDGGGPLWPTFGFTNPRGHAFIGIDGKCRFYVGQNYMRGVVSGTLSTSEAAQVAADFHWNDLDGWAGYGVSKDAPCPDAGIVAVMKAKAAAGCSCGCDPAAPAGLADALKHAYEWLDKLAASGKPLDGPVSAVILDSDVSGLPPNQMKFDWPLSRTIESIPNLRFEGSASTLWTGPWARFDDSAEFTKLRDLRAKTFDANNGNGAQFVIVRAGGKDYALYVRDELPTEADKAWTALKSSVPKF